MFKHVDACFFFKPGKRV